MANPPITVGELTDVPAPGSPINAQFHQETANRICHRFATGALMNAWTPTAGALAYNAENNFLYLRRGGAWHPIANLQNSDAAYNAAVDRSLGIVDHRTGGRQTIGTTLATVTGCQITFTADPTRWYRTSAAVPFFESLDEAPMVSVWITDGAGAGLMCARQSIHQFYDNAQTVSLVEPVLSGSVTRRLMMSASVGHVEIYDYPSVPSLTVEDCGAR